MVVSEFHVGKLCLFGEPKYSHVADSALFASVCPMGGARKRRHHALST